MSAHANCNYRKYFGRDNQAGQKRARSKHVKVFTASFRTDKYRQHHEREHSKMWKDYQASENKAQFFQVTKPNPSTHTLLSHFYAPASAQFTISQSIVEDVICKLYWRDNEEADGAADDVVSFRNKNEASSAVNFREARRGALVTLLPNS